MALIKTSFVRKASFRDASLIVIAAEGESENIYFSALKESKIHKRQNVHVEFLCKEQYGLSKNDSSPINVIKMLNQFKKQYSIGENDELWLVVDRDGQSFKKHQISDVATQCLQKKYHLAVSNPCFEFWLLLHLVNIDRDDIPCYKNEYVNNNKRYLEGRLSSEMNGYNKSAYKTDLIIPHVNDAINRAMMLDQNKQERWPSRLGTRVYLLAEKIINPNIPL